MLCNQYESNKTTISIAGDPSRDTPCDSQPPDKSGKVQGWQQNGSVQPVGGMGAVVDLVSGQNLERECFEDILRRG